MIDVNYNNWNKWYEKILNDFKFSKSADEKSAKLLNSLIQNKYDIKSDNLYKKNKCIIVGAGPSIKNHINILKEFNLNNYVIIAADGATKALNEENIIPDIIVTDLDGDTDSIIYSNINGSILYVHAHGDNEDKLILYLTKLSKIIPTTQVDPFGKLENYGGFTDGDRAIHIAVYGLKMKEIILAGMDFGDYVTKYSRPSNKHMIQEADNIKKLKLEYAKILTDELIHNNPDIKFEFIN